MGWHDDDISKIDRKRWARLRQEVLTRDDWRCVKCKRRGRLEVDHIIPMRFGGEVYALSNLQTLCRAPCHFEKSARENEAEPESVERAEWREFVKE